VERSLDLEKEKMS